MLNARWSSIPEIMLLEAHHRKKVYNDQSILSYFSSSQTLRISLILLPKSFKDFRNEKVKALINSKSQLKKYNILYFLTYDNYEVSMPK